MVVRHSPPEAAVARDPTTLTSLFQELARLTVSAARTNPTSPDAFAADLLGLLLRATLADKGALVLASMPAGAATPHKATDRARWASLERVLACTGMTLDELTHRLDGGPSDQRHAPMSVLVWPLLLGGRREGPGSLADSASAAGMDRCVAIVLGWTARPDAANRLDAARRWLAQIADAVLALIMSLLTSERLASLAARALEQDAARLEWQQALDAIPDPISIVTPDFRLVRANAAYQAMFGYDPSLPGAHRCFAQISGDMDHDHPCADCPLPDTIATGRPGFAQRERRVPTSPAGALKRRIYQTWTYPARNAAGVVDHVVEILKDVTEQEQLRAELSQAEALKEADRLKAELLGTVSHELRNPMAAIKGYASTLLRHERRLPRAERHEYLCAIEQASDRLESIIGRLLEMSQLETGTTSMQRAAVDMSRIISEALTAQHEALRPRLPAELRFTVAITNDSGEAMAEAPLVAGDPRLLRIVVDNLLENAVKYSPQGGEIAVTVSPAIRERAAMRAPLAREFGGPSPGRDGQPASDPEPLLDICVRDHGVGIPAAHLGRIFDRFHRVDNRLIREVDGLGLGLAICKRIVEMHSGAIWAESRPDGGSAFHVLLPLAQTRQPGVSREGL